MEQPDHLAGFIIDTRDIWPFVPIAMYAGERKVVHIFRTAVLPRDNMIDLKRRGMNARRQPAVFAKSAGSLANTP